MISRRRFIVLGGASLLAACNDGPTSESVPTTTRASSSFPKPKRYAVSGWSTDPFALGSYSFLKRGSSAGDREILAEPVEDRIFFAGEATALDHPATVHGAIGSGERAAEEVMEATDGTVIIVGAGAAGLAAAAILDDEDYDVVILDGRDRVGGRLWTDTRSLSVPVDLGASWIHGVRGNPVTALTTDFGIETAAFDYDDAITYDEDGNELDDADIPDDFEIASEIEHEFAADEDELDADAAEEEGEDELPGGDRLVVGGYQRVADGIVDGYDLDVTLRTTVEEIRLARGGVEVVTKQKTHRGAAVIVTVPLGVLQAGRPRFTPGLPAAKTAAIKRLGMGVLSKCVLEFDRVFWDDVSMIGLAGRNPRTEWTEFVNLAPFTGKPIIMGFSAGRAARAMEAKPAAAIAASATAALQSIYG